MKSWCNSVRLREECRDKRKALSSEFVSLASQKISEKILASSFFKKANHIAYYLSHENEVDLNAFAKIALSQGKKLYLPIFNKPHHLHFYQVDENTHYQKNQFGILEPISSALITLDKLDLMLIPLVAFDKQGNRLGRGLGCYDRYLQHNKHCKLVGVAYDFQCVDKLDAKAWDVRLDAVVTEKV